MAQYYIESLLPPGQPRWNSGSNLGTPTNVTFSFMTQAPSYYGNDAKERNNFVAFNQVQMNAARQALSLWSEVANITFTEVSDAGSGGKIRFGTANLPSGYAAWGYYPRTNEGGDVWLSNTSASNFTQTPGSYGFQTMLHEIGHALGLKHPGNYDAGGGGTPGPYLPSGEDNRQYTVMSYYGHSGSGIEPLTPMLYDIAAMQYLYGANYSTRAGNDTYSWNPYQPLLMAIWDGGGIDTISAENQIVSASIDLRAGKFSSIGLRNSGDFSTKATNNLAIAFGVTIENAIGSAFADQITGNEVNNSLYGGNGNDTLYGLEGNDQVDGGDGNDQVYGGAGNDYIDGWNGDDQLYGEAGNDTLLGWYGNDYLNGGDGNDYLNGQAGNDFVVGWEGNDTLYGQDGNDTLWAGNGNDYLFGGNGDDQLAGWNDNDSLYGENGNDFLYGEAGNDLLYGGDGNDTLDGGTGSDQMYGGAGNDIYYIDAQEEFYLDTVHENANEGIDTVFSSANFSGLDSNVENITLIGTAYGANGNNLDNIMTGNDSNNFLWGNTGSDSLSGGGGNDTLNGYGYGSIAEYDTLTGGSGADLFVLGSWSQTSYVGAGYATITDFNWGESDKFQVHGTINDYSLDTGNWSGSSDLDTGIYYQGDLIAVAQDKSGGDVLLNYDFNFVT